MYYVIESLCIFIAKNFGCTIVESITLYIWVHFIFRCEQPTLLAMGNGVNK